MLPHRLWGVSLTNHSGDFWPSCLFVYQLHLLSCLSLSVTISPLPRSSSVTRCLSPQQRRYKNMDNNMRPVVNRKLKGEFRGVLVNVHVNQHTSELNGNCSGRIWFVFTIVSFPSGCKRIRVAAFKVLRSRTTNPRWRHAGSEEKLCQITSKQQRSINH